MSSPMVFKDEWVEAARDLKAAQEGLQEAQQAVATAKIALDMAQMHVQKLARESGLDILHTDAGALTAVVMELVDPWPRFPDGTPHAGPA